MFLNIVNRSVAKTIVGDSLCYNADWLRTCLETTVDTGKLVQDLQGYASFLRPLVIPWLGARKSLDCNFHAAVELLSPLIQIRQPGDRNTDILQWLIDDQSDSHGNCPSVEFLTSQVLFVATAAIRSTAASVVNTIFDAASHPDHQGVLHADIEAALAEEGGWCLAAVDKMKQVDSFIKESQRLNHHLLRKRSRPVLPIRLRSN